MKYKLIKTYPGSPELGTIVEGNVQLWSPDENQSIICSKHPEFWEKVVEKDFEILSFSQNVSNEIVQVSKTDLALTVEEFFKNKNWNIHSVKRLS